MQPETYIILRVPGSTTRGAELEAGPVWRGEEPVARGLDEVTYQVETERLDRRDLHDLRRDPEVKALAPPIPVRLVKPVADPALAAEPPDMDGVTWGVYVIGAVQSPYTGHGVTVAVLDTGIDAGHEAFQGIDLVQKDFTGEGDGDVDGHGTHVAGTIFGQTTHGLRYSVAPGVRRALIGKVLGQEGGSTDRVVAAIQWAVEQGAQVINLSLGFDFPGLVQKWVEQGLPVDFATSHALQAYRANVRLFDRLVGLIDAQALFAAGAVLIAAAGNESKRQLHPDYEIAVAPPAAADGIISIGALQTTGAPHTQLDVAPFSNTNPWVAAPGVGIYSAQAGGGYTYLSGTSMASPHAAGVAALWAEKQRRESGMVNSRTLSAQLQGRASHKWIVANADTADVGEGLVSAPR